MPKTIIDLDEETNRAILQDLLNLNRSNDSKARFIMELLHKHYNIPEQNDSQQVDTNL